MRKVRAQPILLILTLGMLVMPLTAWGQGVFTTQYTVLFYNQAIELTEMSRRLHLPPVKGARRQAAFVQDSKQAALAPGLAAKIDGLFIQVCKILDRRPPKLRRLRLALLEDRRQVKQRQLACQGALPGQSLFGYLGSEGFYEASTQTIFLSMADLRQGILVHEMTHFVLCEAAAPAPPPELQEHWARYVEIACE